MYRHWRHTFAPLRMLRQFYNGWMRWRRFWDSYYRYFELNSTVSINQFDQYNRFTQENFLQHLYPCIDDATTTTPIEPTYFYQDAWAFEHIVKIHPQWHVDVGSHHKFVALLSKVVDVTMVDIRPLSLPLATLAFRQGSILDLPFEDNSVPSVSSLCVVEHIGLGRYGDPLDPLGTEKAISELKRIVKPGGNLYISIPLDRENLTYFNAHRAFTENYLKSLFSPYEIIESRYIYGNEFCEELRPKFGTGCYLLKKLVRE